MPEVNIDVYTKTHGSEQALGGVKDGLKGVQDGADGAEKSSGGLWKQFAAGVIAAGLIEKGVAAAKNEIISYAKAAIEADSAERAMTTAIELSGRSVEDTLPSLKLFATDLSKATMYTDEQAMSAAALLAQMTDLDANGIQRAIKGSAGLATVMGIDLNSAATLVMKAMEGNYVGLSRYGIKVDENLTAEEKRAAILDQLEGMYGRAEAATESYAGQLDQAKKNIDEMKESVGKLILEKTGLLGILRDVTAGIRDLAEAETMEKEASAREAENMGRLYTNMWQAAQAAGMTYDAFEELTYKYKDNYVAMELAIAKGKEGVTLQEELRNVVHGHVEAKQAEIDKLHEAAEAEDKARAAKEAAKKAAEEYTAFLNSLGIYTQQQQNEEWKKAQQALKDLDSMLASGKISQEKYKEAVYKVNEDLRKHGIIIDTALPKARDLQVAWDKCPKTLKDLDGEMKTADEIFEEVGNAMGYSANTAFLLAYELQRLTLAAAGIVLPDLRIPDSTKTQVKQDVDEFKGMWDGLFNEVSSKWGDVIGDFIEGNTSIETTWNRLWKTLWETVKDYIGKIVTEWIVKGMKSIVSGSEEAAGKAGEALGGIGTTVSNVAGTVGGAIESLAGSILGVIENIATTVIDIVAYGLTTLATAIATAITTLAAAAPALLEIGLAAAAVYGAFKLAGGLADAIGGILGGSNSGAGDGMGRVVERLDDFLAGWHWWYLDVVAILSFIQGQNDHRADQLDTINGTIHMWGAEIRDAIYSVRNAVEGIPGAAGGGVSMTTQLVRVHGTPEKPEYIIPHDDMGRFVAGVGFRRAPGGETAAAPAAGSNQTINITLSGPLVQATTGLSEGEIQRAGEKLLSTMEYELRRRGLRFANG